MALLRAFNSYTFYTCTMTMNHDIYCMAGTHGERCVIWGDFQTALIPVTMGKIHQNITQLSLEKCVFILLKWRFVNYQWLPYVPCYIIKCWPVQYAVTSSWQRAHSKRNQCLLKSEDTSSTTSLPVSLIKTSSYSDWSWRRPPSSKAFILIKSNDLSQIQFVGEELLDADLVGLN